MEYSLGFLVEQSPTTYETRGNTEKTHPKEMIFQTETDLVPFFSIKKMQFHLQFYKTLRYN